MIETNPGNNELLQLLQKSDSCQDERKSKTNTKHFSFSNRIWK